MLGFTNLGNVDGFQDPGSGVYGLLLSKDGYYVRTSVQPEEPEWEVKLTITHPHINLRPGRGGIIQYLGNGGGGENAHILFSVWQGQSSGSARV